MVLNAGLFPKSIELEYCLMELIVEDIKKIDIWASYMTKEAYLANELEHCVIVNLNGFYAPFMWNNPWTTLLRGKNVLVIHPFAESIQKQYRKRENLFDKEVLPEFKSLTVIKAVQSIAGNGPCTGFDNWFDALEYMEKKDG